MYLAKYFYGAHWSSGLLTIWYLLIILLFQYRIVTVKMFREDRYTLQILEAMAADKLLSKEWANIM